MRKKVKLTEDDHREIAAHLNAINDHIIQVLRLTSGKVPVALLDRFLTGSMIDRKLAQTRMKFEDLLYKNFPELPETVKRSIY